MVNNPAVKARKKNRYFISLIFLLRAIAGGVFIFSGFVKAVDPWGTVYKFEEYFNVLGFSWLASFSTFLSFCTFIFEFTFGIFLFWGCYRRVAPVMTLLLMSIFLPLTGWLAITEAVPDCGCFGDAFYLSNTLTFIKNVVLTAVLVFLVIYNVRAKNIYGFAVQWIVWVLSGVFILAIGMLSYLYQPLIDFMPFKVGTPLVAESDIDDSEYIFVYEKDGERSEFSIDSIPEDEAWTFVERIEIGEKDESAAELSIFAEGEDITHSVIDDSRNQILFLFPELGDVEVSYTYKINEISTLARANGIEVVGLTSASAEEIVEWNDISMADYPIYSIDDSVLKQIARGNPAIVYLENGVIEWKRTLQSISDDIVLSQSFNLHKLDGDVNNRKLLVTFIFIYVVSMIVLLIINRTHKVIKFSRRKSGDIEE